MQLVVKNIPKYLIIKNASLINMNELPVEVIVMIVNFLPIRDRISLRQTSSFFYMIAWSDDEYSYFNCPHRNVIDRENLCYQCDHLSCVKHFQSSNISKLEKAILSGSTKVFDYYSKYVDVSQFNSNLYIQMIADSNTRALSIMSNNQEMIGRLSLHIDSIIRTSDLEFIMEIIRVVYHDNYSEFYQEFNSDIIENDRSDVMSILFDHLTNDQILGENRVCAIVASSCRSERIISLMRTSVGDITPLRDEPISYMIYSH